MMKFLLRVMSSMALLTACSPSSGGRSEAPTSTIAVPGASDPSTTPPVQSSLPEGVASDKVRIEFDPFTVTPVIFVQETAENVCLPFRLRVTAEGKAVEGATVVFKVSPMSVMKDLGDILTVSPKSNSAGEIDGTYCSGSTEGSVVIAAEVGGMITNSAVVRVTVKPIYKLAYVRTDADPLQGPTEGLGDNGAVYLNLIDSGPQDCTSLYFKLTKADKPVVATRLMFRSQIDFPAGAKFAKKTDPVKTAPDPITGKSYLTFETFTNSSGEASVPVCAGVFLGSLDVAVSYVDEEDKRYEAHSPVVRIVGGLTNWINMSLMFDEANGRTLRGYFNTNSKYMLPITANIGSRMDGMPIKQYPLMVATETGRVVIEDGGSIDPETGAVKFKVQALHLGDNYPYQVNAFEDVTLAATRCHPEKIAQWGAANSMASVNYTDVAKNWRSTLVYYTRGQEHYNDANGNGKYDAGGDGFWDRNQNGYYDSEDVLTFDAGNDGLLNRRGEWFIDLPTPFIDVDEDRVYNPNIDVLIGEKYEAPNGKRDSDTTNWKSEVLPISMGPSYYSLQHSSINTTDYTITPATVAIRGQNFNVFGVDRTITPTDLFSAPADYANSASWDFAVFAHDLCGSLLPGSTKIAAYVQELTEDDDVDNLHEISRHPRVHFIAPPEDQFLEPTRRLLKTNMANIDNNSFTTWAFLNFNAIDHPSKDIGYPVTGRIYLPKCERQCSGAVNPADPGLYCSAWSGNVWLEVEEPALGSEIDSSRSQLVIGFEIPAIKACKCVGGGVLSNVTGSCQCPTGQAFNQVSLTCQ